MELENILTGSTPLHSDNITLRTTANNRSNPERINSEQGSEEAITKEKVESIITELNDMTKPLRTNLQFKLHEKLNEYYVEVVNPLTDEVIKEIPPKQMLDRYAAMAEFMGLLVDEQK